MSVLQPVIGHVPSAFATVPMGDDETANETRTQPEIVDLVDIGNVWTWLDPVNVVPFTGEINPDVPGLTDAIELADETWTNADGTLTVSRTEPGTVTKGDIYSYSATVHAKSGHIFGESFDFVYDGTLFAWDDIQVTFSADRTTATISGFIDDQVVAGFPIRNAMVSGLKSTTYTGKPQTQTPTVTVSAQGRTIMLTEGADYRLSYSGNIEVGTATVNIIGLGDYDGTAKAGTFRINHVDYSKIPDLTIGQGWWLSNGGKFPGLETFYLDYAMAHGIMRGNEDGTFAPEKPLTRAEAAVVIYRMCTGETDNGKDANATGIPDVQSGQWYTRAVNWCVGEGIITGYKNEKTGKVYAFGPNDIVTREQIATMIARLVAGRSGEALDGYSTVSLVHYRDRADIGNWAREGVAYCYDKGIMAGNPDGTFDPWADTTRAAMAKVASVVHKSYL